MVRASVESPPPAGVRQAGDRSSGVAKATVRVGGSADPADGAEQAADGHCGYGLDADRVVAGACPTGDLRVALDRLLVGGGAWAVLLVRCSRAGDRGHGLSGSRSGQRQDAARAVVKATAARCRNGAPTDAPYERCRPTD